MQADNTNAMQRKKRNTIFNFNLEFIMTPLFEGKIEIET
tara:strand:- start:1388 stop:1504 length:117 start_codon:yes stop_codon:yes gene_type:complete